MSLPNGPKTPPLLLLLRWIADPISILQACAQQYGECFTLNLGRYAPFVFFSHPEAIEQIFALGDDAVQVGSSNSILRPTLGDHSLLLLDGDRHQRQRQLLMPSFHGERMRAYGALIQQVTEQEIQTWTADQVFTLRPAMQRISLQVIIEAIFGVQDSDRAQALQQRTADLLHLTTSPLGFASAFFPILQRDFGQWSPGGNFLYLKQQVDELIYAEIRDGRSHLDPNRTDVLSLMMAAVDEQGQGMTDVELRDELMTLLLAGHETTATALSWALYWIYQNPALVQQLRDELAQPSEGDRLSLMRLPLLNAVCMETLRIYPVAFIAGPRFSQKPISIMGTTFPANTLLTPCIYLAHRRPELYSDPETFRPERFLDRQFSAFEFLPFGGGNRRCIGSAFALFEMKQVLATILSHCDVAIAEPQPVRPVRRGVTIAPKTGIRARLVTSQNKGTYISTPMPNTVPSKLTE